jgi:hypothetical protein
MSSSLKIQQAPLAYSFSDGQNDQGALEELNRSRENLQQALYARQNQLFDPVLLAMAQGFLSPTKTGSFGETLGNVAARIAPVQEAEQKRAQEIAEMRYALAQQEVAQNQVNAGMRMAQGLFSGAKPSGPQPTGQATPEGAPTAPTGAAPEVSGGAPVSGLQNVTGAHVAALGMMPGMKSFADALEKGIKLDRDRFKSEGGVFVDVGAAGGPKVILDLRGGEQKPTEVVIDGKRMVVNMSPSEEFQFRTAKEKGQESAFFDKMLKGRRTDVDLPASGGQLQEINVPLLGPEVKFMGTPRQAAMVERLSEEAQRTRNPAALSDYVNEIRFGMRTPMTGAPAAPRAATRAAPMSADEAFASRPSAAQPAAAQPAAGQPARAQAAPQPVTSDLAQLPLKEQNEEIIKRISAADKPAQEQQALIMKSASPEVIAGSNLRLKEINNLVTKHPNVVGLMNQQGLLAALGRLAQEGARVGQYSVSLPVNEFLENLKLSPQEQRIARRITMLLDEEFFNRAQLSKSALGPQISNADTVLMKSPMARPQDAAPLIKYWALHGILTNKQLDDMYRGLNSWQDRTGGRAPARQFFNTDARTIMDSYTPMYEQLQQRFLPSSPPAR